MPENMWNNKSRCTENELCEYWGIKLCTLRKWRTLCTGPVYIKIGSRILYTRDAIEEYERNRMFRGSAERIRTENPGGSHDTEK